MRRVVRRRMRRMGIVSIMLMMLTWVLVMPTLSCSCEGLVHSTARMICIMRCRRCIVITMLLPTSTVMVVIERTDYIHIADIVISIISVGIGRRIGRMLVRISAFRIILSWMACAVRVVIEGIFLLIDLPMCGDGFVVG